MLLFVAYALVCWIVNFFLSLVALIVSIFDKMTNEEVAEYVATEMSLPNADPAIVAGKLVEQSLKAGSRDNMSAIVVQFSEDGTAYSREGEEFIAGPFYQYSDNSKFRRCYEADAARSGYTGARLWEAAYKASVEELDKTIFQMRIRMEQNNMTQQEFTATCASMRRELKELFDADMAKCS